MMNEVIFLVGFALTANLLGLAYMVGLFDLIWDLVAKNILFKRRLFKNWITKEYLEGRGLIVD